MRRPPSPVPGRCRAHCVSTVAHRIFDSGCQKLSGSSCGFTARQAGARCQSLHPSSPAGVVAGCRPGGSPAHQERVRTYRSERGHYRHRVVEISQRRVLDRVINRNDDGPPALRADDPPETQSLAKFSHEPLPCSPPRGCRPRPAGVSSPHPLVEIDVHYFQTLRCTMIGMTEHTLVSWRRQVCRSPRTPAAHWR